MIMFEDESSLEKAIMFSIIQEIKEIESQNPDKYFKVIVGLRLYYYIMQNYAVNPFDNLILDFNCTPNIAYEFV